MKSRCARELDNPEEFCRVFIFCCWLSGRWVLGLETPGAPSLGRRVVGPAGSKNHGRKEPPFLDSGLPSDQRA
jgi:hypothetical protein